MRFLLWSRCHSSRSFDQRGVRDASTQKRYRTKTERRGGPREGKNDQRNRERKVKVKKIRFERKEGYGEKLTPYGNPYGEDNFTQVFYGNRH